jgi:hypothetical protein
VEDRDFAVGFKLHLQWLIRIFFFLLAIALGASHTWTAMISNSMNPDGISYLDMGDAYLRGDWNMAINAYWSPFYAWLLGIGMRILNPGMQWEFPVVHLINLIIYLGTLVCFEFFLQQLIRYSRGNLTAPSNSKIIALPEWALLSLGYVLFIYTSLNLIEIWSVTPDMCVAAFVYLAAGLELYIRTRKTSWRPFSFLGIALGFGYLAKAPMFPIAFMFLIISLYAVDNLRRAIPLTLISLTCFLLIGAPYIIALSHTQGRLTFGDSGILNYVRYVNGLPDAHWQGDIPDNGVPVHPTRKILDEPAIYEFGSPVGGTYPPWYDPTYWYEGVIPKFNWQEQLGVLLTNTLFYFDLFLRRQGVLATGIVLLYLLRDREPVIVKNIIRQWGLLILALAAFVMYAMVYVETRYLAPFVMLFWANLLVNIHLPDLTIFRRLISLLSITMILFMLANIAVFNVEGLRDYRGLGNPRQLAVSQASPPSRPGEVAEKLRSLGVQQGDKVAIIGYGFDSFWARLARVQIVAELIEWEANPFWVGGPVVQSKVIQAFASTGARAIVAESVPDYASLPGWRQLGNTDYYVYLFSH